MSYTADLLIRSTGNAAEFGERLAYRLMREMDADTCSRFMALYDVSLHLDFLECNKRLWIEAIIRPQARITAALGAVPAMRWRTYVEEHELRHNAYSNRARVLDAVANNMPPAFSVGILMQIKSLYQKGVVT